MAQMVSSKSGSNGREKRRFAHRSASTECRNSSYCAADSGRNATAGNCKSTTSTAQIA
jgi:hypothetical protein